MHSNHRRRSIEQLEQRLPRAGMVVDFETLGAALDPESAWNGPDPNGELRLGIDGDNVVVGRFLEAGVSFNNIFSQDFGSWNGWAYSNFTDSTTPGFGNQFSAFSGGGADDSLTYAVAFRDTRDGIPWEDTYPLPSLQLESAAGGGMFQSVMIANTTYAALAMRDGDSFTEKFGGPSGDDPDWLLLTIEGRTAAGDSLGVVELYLADYRFGDNSQDYILDSWNEVDLTPLAAANNLEFRITSSDVGLFGINTPAYFALDNLVLAAAEVPLAVAALTPTDSGFVTQFNQPLDTAALNVFPSDLLGPADVALVGQATGPIAGSLVVAPSGDSLTFVKTGGPLLPDTYSVVLRSATDGVRDALAAPLDGDGDGVAGGHFESTFVVAGRPAGAVTVGVPDFVRGPGQAVDVPAGGPTGIPLALDEGQGIRNVEVQISYDANSLELGPAQLVDGLPSGATVELSRDGPGRATVRFASPSELSAGRVVFARLEASVPAENSEYGTTAVLDIHSVVITNSTGASLPAIGDDGLHLVSYFGDASGNGQINALDASLVAALAATISSGFAGLPLADPRVVADITGNGRVNAVDASVIAQFNALIAVPEIPPLPNTAMIAGAVPGGSRHERMPADVPLIETRENPAVLLPALAAATPWAITEVTSEEEWKRELLLEALDTVLASWAHENLPHN